MGVGVVGGAPHTHAHAHTCMHAHWGNPWEFPMMSYACACMCTCMHACACAHGLGAPTHHPAPHPPTQHLSGGTPGIIQNSIALELIEIFQFCLKF